MDPSTSTLLITVTFFSLSITTILFTEYAFAFVFAPPGSSPTDRDNFNASRQICKASHRWCQDNQRFIAIDKDEDEDGS